MFKFSEFCERKDQERIIAECAMAISESGRDADEVLLELFGKGFMNMVKGFGQLAGQTAQGFQKGREQQKDTTSGAVVKFEKATAALKELAEFLNSNDKTKGIPSVSGSKQGWTVATYVQKVLEALEKERSNMPKMNASNEYEPAGGGQFGQGSFASAMDQYKKLAANPQNKDKAEAALAGMAEKFPKEFEQNIKSKGKPLSAAQFLDYYKRKSTQTRQQPAQVQQPAAGTPTMRKVV